MWSIKQSLKYSITKSRKKRVDTLKEDIHQRNVPCIPTQNNNDNNNKDNNNNCNELELVTENLPVK